MDVREAERSLKPAHDPPELLGLAIGNFVLRELVDGGPLAHVYLAEHAGLQRRVAVRVLREGADADEAARFLAEARITGALHHAHVVEIFDIGALEGGRPYVIFEWLGRRSLGALLKKEPSFARERVAHIARGIAHALGAAHEHGLVHRNLTPESIYLVERKEDPDFVKIVGFSDGKDPANGLRLPTASAELRFLAPEQCCGARSRVDARTDTYALGLIVYQLLSGRPPFGEEEPAELLLAQMTRVPELPSALRASFPGAAAALSRALAKDPAGRPARVEAFVEELTAGLGLPSAGNGAALVASMPPIEPVVETTFFAKAHDRAPDSAGPEVASGHADPDPALDDRAGSDEEWPRRGPRPLTFIVSLVALVVVVGAVGLVRARRKPAAAPVATFATARAATFATAPAATFATAPAPTFATAPAPSPANRTAPAPQPGDPGVHIRIAAEPHGATMTIDGHPIANPYEATVPTDEWQHLIEARAPDRAAARQWVSFDRSRDIVLRLDPSAGARAPREPATRPAAADRRAHLEASGPVPAKRPRPAATPRRPAGDDPLISAYPE